MFDSKRSRPQPRDMKTTIHSTITNWYTNSYVLYVFLKVYEIVVSYATMIFLFPDHVCSDMNEIKQGGIAVRIGHYVQGLKYHELIMVLGVVACRYTRLSLHMLKFISQNRGVTQIILLVGITNKNNRNKTDDETKFIQNPTKITYFRPFSIPFCVKELCQH